MKEMQYRIDVLEEFFQLNTMSLGQVGVQVPVYVDDPNHHIQFRYRLHHSILSDLTKRGDERAMLLYEIYTKYKNGEQRFLLFVVLLKILDSPY